MLEPLLNYVVAAARGDRAAFLERFPESVLVVEPFSKGGDGQIQTLAHDASGGGAVAVGRLRKREGANAFGNMITIGRAGNNDVQILQSGVSKFHAYVTLKEGAAHLVDAGSSLGTSLNGRRLTGHGDPLPLTDGASVLLGQVQATFFSSNAFFDYLLSPAP